VNLELATVCLQDADERTRRSGAALLASEISPEADNLLMRALADPADTVWQTARAALIYRYPWLVIEPSAVRPAPDSALDGKYGQALSNLRQAIGQALREPGSDRTLRDRLLTIPGAIPDVIEVLQSKGRIEEAAEIAGLSDAAGNRHASRQIMMAPTYRCNLTCSYCYAKNFGDGFPPDMTLEDLKAAVSWAAEQGIRRIILGGGEPTVYTHLPRLFELAKERGIAVHLTSNCLYPTAVREIVKAPPIPELVAHYEQERMSVAESAAGLFTSNIEAARAAGVNVLIRYTLTAQSGPDEWRAMMDLAQRLSVGQINYALAFRGCQDLNAHLAYQQSIGSDSSRLDELLAAFCADAALRGLRLHLSKPFPLCSIKMESLRAMLGGEALRASCAIHLDDFTRNLTINPDLSTFPCNGIAIRGPRIIELTSIEEAGRLFAPAIRELMMTPYVDACRHCALWYRGFCQGSCLAEHYLIARQAGNPLQIQDPCE